jgi:predicted O-linked N-acetylglucosamine transferase (SPINDLY family)
VGYLSADFRQHSVAWFFESILENHDQQRFHVSCYHNTKVCDAVTERLMGRADAWVECATMTDSMLADRIRADEIDILVDLSGHTAGHRLSVLAMRPAPIQMTYLGYPTTTGLAAIDYRITDVAIDPLNEPNMNAEKPLRCTHSMFCYRPDIAPALQEAPVEATGVITFGSFNNGVKLSDKALALWAQVLSATPNSQLFVKTQGFSHESVRDQMRARFRAAGIEDERVRFSAWRSDKASHLELYREVDIALDTFPYNGATTTCEALWMGVPVISLKGATHVSRMGASILSAAGLAHWIATDAEQFVSIATALAADRASIAGFRRSARARLLTSPLMDAKQFTVDFENLLAQSWCVANEPIASL